MTQVLLLLPKELLKHMNRYQGFHFYLLASHITVAKGLTLTCNDPKGVHSRQKGIGNTYVFLLNYIKKI